MCDALWTIAKPAIYRAFFFTKLDDAQYIKDGFRGKGGNGCWSKEVMADAGAFLAVGEGWEVEMEEVAEGVGVLF